MRRVILTTLSTLPNNAKMNYYYSKDYENGEERFCTGVYQMEPGIKFLMSKYDIDEIIGIASEKIVIDNPQMLLNESQLISKDTALVDLKENENGNRENAILKNSIVRFFSDNPENTKKVWKDIDVKRREEISQIVDSHLKEISEKNIIEYQNCFNKVKVIIKNDIESNFIREEEYSKYQVDKITQFEEIEKYLSNKWNSKVNFDELWAMHGMENDTQINREYYYMQLAEFYKDKAIELQNKVGVEEKLIYRLNDANKRFIEEIKVMKDQRVAKEQDFAKSLLYHNLAMNRTMKPVDKTSEVYLKYIREKDVEKDIDNIQGIVDAIKGTDDDVVEVYIDMQGGSRTDGYIRQAVMSILNNELDSKVITKEIIATAYENRNLINEIVDESGRYGINELVAGMNAFIQYGKADLIKKYSDSVNAGNERALVDAMVEVDDALSLCDTGKLYGALNKIKAFYADNPESNTVFSVLIEGIKNDYGKLLEGDSIELAELVKWCLRKKFVQQALTIIESKMPDSFVNKGILFYAKNDNCESVKNDWIQFYEMRKSVQNQKGNEPYKWKDLNHYFIKYYGYNAGVPNIKLTVDLIDNEHSPIKVCSLIEKNKAKDLCEKYELISAIRNEICHVEENEYIPQVTELAVILEDFIEQYENIISEINGRNKDICSLSSSDIPSVSNRLNSNSSIEGKVKKAYALALSKRGEKQNVFVATHFDNKGALIGFLRGTDGKICKENFSELTFISGKKIELLQCVEIEIKDIDPIPGSEKIKCTPKDPKKMIEDLKKHIVDKEA